MKKNVLLLIQMHHAQAKDYQALPKFSNICFVNEEDVETAIEMGTWGNGDVYTILDTQDYYVNSIFSGVVSGEFTPAELVESTKQLFQDMIDATFNQ
jgi:hypothetical protein